MHHPLTNPAPKPHPRLSRCPCTIACCTNPYPYLSPKPNLNPSPSASLNPKPPTPHPHQVLMHQDVLHRVSTPSMLAHRPRYSLVWKLLFVPRHPKPHGGAAETICRPAPP